MASATFTLWKDDYPTVCPRKTPFCFCVLCSLRPTPSLRFFLKSGFELESPRIDRKLGILGMSSKTKSHRARSPKKSNLGFGTTKIQSSEPSNPGATPQSASEIKEPPKSTENKLPTPPTTPTSPAVTAPTSTSEPVTPSHEDEKKGGESAGNGVGAAAGKWSGWIFEEDHGFYYRAKMVDGESVTLT
jgi:hypothetical protein